MKWTDEQIERYREMYMAGATYQQLAFEFGVTYQSALELRRRKGMPERENWTHPKRRTPPADLAEVIEKLGVTGARDHYTVGWATLRRWTLELGIKIDRTKRYKPVPVKKPLIPEDWAVNAPKMFRKELAAHYRMSTKTVNKIIGLTGIEAKKKVAKPKPALKPKHQRTAKWTGWRLPGWRTITEGSPATTHSIAAEAARFLRSFYSNVHRCDILMREGSNVTWGDEHKVPNHGKGWYRVGPKTMTEFDMINHALERGMNA